jgi:hypothetical protein
MDSLHDDAPQDELSALKARADLLGISYHPSIGLEKLREKVNAKIQGQAAPEAAVAEQTAGVAPTVRPPTADELAKAHYDAAMKLIRVRLQCMNPNKKEWEGEIFSVSNRVIGTVRKYIPFNADDGWHIPQIMLDMLDARQCQSFYTVTGARGEKVRKGKLIKEFAIEILPQLTKEELADLARRQAMAQSVD